jgi:GT2 family glycosyltransferase
MFISHSDLYNNFYRRRKMYSTIITSMYNRNRNVIETIDRLFFPSLLNNASTDYELVILDDHSWLEKETRTLLEKYWPDLRNKFGNIIITRNPANLGFAKSYNRGIRMASGKRLLIANDDVYFPRGSIAKLFDTLLEPAGYMVTGPITNASTSWSFQYCKQAPSLKSYSSAELEKLEVFARWLENKMGGVRLTTDNLCGFCFAADTKFLKTMGGFNEYYQFGLFEDTDLIQRIVRDYGQEKVAINLEVFINHGGLRGTSRSIMQLPAKVFYYSLVNAYKYAKQWGAWKLIQRLGYGPWSQITGKGTVSELLPKKILL